jgi:hypothetical protein
MISRKRQELIFPKIQRLKEGLEPSVKKLKESYHLLLAQQLNVKH